MKKTLTVIVHVLSVLVFTAAFSALYLNNTGDSGITWVSSETYEDSPQFADAVNTDIGNLKRLAQYEDAFGEITDIAEKEDYESIVTVQDAAGRTEYTAGELLEIASKYGCTLDFETGTVTQGKVTAAGMENEDVRVVAKAYDPGFLQNLEPGPSQGIMSLRELSTEVVRVLSDYIKMQAEYGPQESNFLFVLYYPGVDDDYISLTNTDIRADSLLKYGKFVHAEGAEGKITTNIEPMPENAAFVPVEEGTDAELYELFVGIDTSFPYRDRYRAAADAFAGKVRAAYSWIGTGIVAFILAVITLVIILVNACPKEEADRETLSDRLPIEAFTVILAILSVICYYLYKLTLGKAVEGLSPAFSQQYLRDTAKTLITYGMCILILRAGIRKYKKGTLYSTSLFNRLELSIEGYLENAGLAGSAFLKFLGFVAVNAGIVFLSYTFYLRRVADARNILIAAVLITLLLVMDALLYNRFYKISKQRDMINDALKSISGGETAVKLSEEDFSGSELETARSINNISVGLSSVVRDQVKAERLKADLITNVSHDIKTPLTSIITYVDLLKRENIQNEKAQEYISVLEKKSQRLKNLTEDLVEASKASSGNIKMEMTVIDIVELTTQAAGEFEDKFAQRGLTFCFDAPEEPFFVRADGRHLWRVYENLFNNAAKYSMENTRIYGDVYRQQRPDGTVYCVFTIKNISETKLNISPEELTERFVRGDVSRTTEGSGLGLSIAQSLTKLMGGELKIEIDGDLYKASVILPEVDPLGENACE